VIVRKRVYESGTVRWALDLGKINGKRSQRFFSSRREAEAALAEAKTKREQCGAPALIFSNEERVRFTAARDRLATAGATIEQAVDFFMQRNRAVREPLTLADLTKRCLLQKELDGKRSRYVGQLAVSWRSFARGREEMMAHVVTSAEVQRWITGGGWAPKTQRVYLGDLHALFAYAVQEGHATENPCAGSRIRLTAMERSEIEALTFAQVKALLERTAKAPADGAEEDFRPLLWYVALGLFAGIRPDEIKRLNRAEIDLEERHVVVLASHSKTRQRRVVDLSANAVEWLQLDPVRTGPVWRPSLRHAWVRLRQSVGLLGHREPAKRTAEQAAMKWPHDAMRHTFASMHYAQHQNEQLLKAQMGHSDREDTLMQHYRALTTRKEAEQFWTLRPNR